MPGSVGAEAMCCRAVGMTVWSRTAFEGPASHHWDCRHVATRVAWPPVQTLRIEYRTVAEADRQDTKISYAIW